MTEYWVSQAKHYCKYCNVWIADNKPSRQHHDNGVKHKQSLETFHKEKREKSLHGARSERELKHQLADIEKAAKLAIANDRQEFYGQFYSGLPSQPPPPPSIGGSDNSSQYDPSQHQLYVPALDGAGTSAQELRENSTGTYEIRGQTYLEGSVHSDKLKEGVYCEIFMEDEDEWIPARLLTRREVSVPHTNIVMKSYDVSYTRPEAFTDKPIRRIEEGVKSDRLRLLATKDGIVMDPTVEQVPNSTETGSSSSSIDRTPQDVNTGLGMWETVSVQLVDEEAQAAENLIREQEEIQLAAQAKKEESRLDELVRQSAIAAESVMSVIDPYGTGMYKGRFVGGSEQIEEDLPSLAKGVSVGFKKRKKVSGGLINGQQTNRSRGLDDGFVEVKSVEEDT